MLTERHSAALSVAQLREAQKHSTGRILPAGLDQQGRHETRPLPAEAYADVVPDTRPAALSMQRHRAIAGRVALALIAGPAVAAVVAVALFIGSHA